MKRSIFDKLKGWKDKKDRKALILKGARQVGKTYILKCFGQYTFPRVHYVNCEQDETLIRIFEKDLRPKRILRDLSFYLDSSIDCQRDLLILDEIQECPRALTSLKYFQEELPGFAICAAGSLLGIELGEGSYPVGKVEQIEMYPMCFEEFLSATGETRTLDALCNCGPGTPIPDIVHTHLWEQLKIYFIVGGLPEIVKTYRDLKHDLFLALKTVRQKQTDLIKAYLADITKHSGKQNAMHIERIWRNIPTQLARVQNGSAPKFKFKGIVPGIRSYSRLAGAIDWLNTAGLIIKIQIVNSGKLPLSAYTAENRFKLCCFDVGLLGAISQLPPKTILSYDYGTYKGYFAENFVAQEFTHADIRPLYSWREKTAEVEFLVEKSGEVLPVEVKSGWVTQAKSLKVFAEKYNPLYRTVLSAKNLQINHYNRLHHYPLYLASRFPLGPVKE